ncbi:hypothetical protein VTO42DRAFT_3294 [Malbranchea cinnamomea]
MTRLSGLGLHGHVQLLLKILETHDISLDTTRVANAWPVRDDQDRPTPRAIAERILKIKSLAKANSNGNDAATPKKVATKSTPRKRGTDDNGTPSLKRSRTKKSDNSPSTVKEEPRGFVKKEESDNGIVTNHAPEDVFAGKSVRTAPALPLGMIRSEFDTDDGEKEYETTDSEYAPPDLDTENHASGRFMEYA